MARGISLPPREELRPSPTPRPRTRGGPPRPGTASVRSLRRRPAPAPTTGGLGEGEDDGVPAHEPRQKREARRLKGPHEKAEGGHGHLAREAAQVGDPADPQPVDHRAREEEERLGQHVGHGVKHPP